MTATYMKRLSLLLLFTAGVLLNSCSPIFHTPQQTGPFTPEPIQPEQQDPTLQNRILTQEDYDQYRQQQQQVQQSTTTQGVTAPTLPTRKDYPVATPIPGKPGYVYNPFNNNPVYVQGIASGRVVRDPKDPNTDHKFRLP